MADFSESMGVKRTKPTPEWFLADYKIYEPAVDWVSRHLRTLGYEPDDAQFDPYMKAWHFRDKAGEHIATVPHDLMERIHNAVFEYTRMLARNRKLLMKG